MATELVNSFRGLVQQLLQTSSLGLCPSEKRGPWASLVDPQPKLGAHVWWPPCQSLDLRAYRICIRPVPSTLDPLCSMLLMPIEGLQRQSPYSPGHSLAAMFSASQSGNPSNPLPKMFLKPPYLCPAVKGIRKSMPLNLYSHMLVVNI